MENVKSLVKRHKPTKENEDMKICAVTQSLSEIFSSLQLTKVQIKWCLCKK